MQASTPKVFNQNYSETKEEGTENHTIVLNTNKAVGDVFSLKVGAKEGEKVGIKGASYDDQGQLLLTDTEVTLYGKITKIDCDMNPESLLSNFRGSYHIRNVPLS